MKCRYIPAHKPQKCGLLESSWNDPVAMMERAVEAPADPIAALTQMYAMLRQAPRLPQRAYYSDPMVGIAVEFWKNYNIIVCDYHGNEWKHGEKIKEAHHDNAV